MEDHEAVEEGVVVLHRGGDLGPAFRGDGGGVKKFGELVEGVADVPAVGAWWCTQGGEVLFGCWCGHYWEGFWGVLVEIWRILEGMWRISR